MNVLVAVLGLAFGSFVTAVTFRLPKKISFIKGRSYCPNCKNKIAWFDNVPLLSYFLLRGKCRKCKRDIPLRYPLIEFVSGIGFLLLYLIFFRFGLLIFILVCFLFLVTLAIFVIDLEHQIIPDELVWLGFIVTFCYLLFFNVSSLWLSLFCGFSSAVFFLLLNLFTKGKGMGLGDVKLAVFLGSFLGWPKTIIWLFCAFLTGALVGVILILLKKARFGKEIAFGPYLVFAFWVALLGGDYLFKLLFSL